MLMQPKPIICVVCTNADTAGTPIHVEWLIKSLRAECQFAVVFGEDGPIAERMRSAGVATSIIPELRSAIKLSRDFAAYKRLATLVRELKPDLLHAHGSKPGVLCRIIGKRLGIPCVHTVHGWGFGKGRPVVQSAAIILSELATTFFCGPSGYIFVSYADRDKGRFVGIRRHRGDVIWNSVFDHGRRARPEATDTIMMSARVAPQKDHGTLLSAFAHAPQREMFLAGEGTATDGFRGIVQDKVGEKAAGISLLGRRDDVPELLAQCGAFVLTSNYEGLPLAIIEAMAAGLPIVATDVGGNRELVEDGVNGYLVPRGDVAALQSALQKLSDPDLRMRMGGKSREFYEGKFSSATAKRRHLDVYSRVLEARPVSL